MKIYELQTNLEEYSHIYQKVTDINDLFIYKYYKSNWEKINSEEYKPISLGLNKSGEGKKNYKTDIGKINGKLLVLSEEAVKVLNPILQVTGQLLAVTSDSKRKKFIGFYPSKNVKPLTYVNLELSDWDEASYGKFFRKIILNKLDFTNEYLFVINEVNIGIFVTEKFKELVEKNNLKGFDFSREVLVNE